MARSSRVFGAIAWVLACQAGGELLARASQLPVSGAILGFFLLLAGLAARRRPQPGLDTVATWLVSRLPIMFVPSAVGLVDQGPLLRGHGVAIAAAAVASTLATLAVTGVVFRRFAEGAQEP